MGGGEKTVRAEPKWMEEENCGAAGWFTFIVVVLLLIIVLLAILLSLLLLAEGSLLSVLIDFHFVRCLVPVNISSFGTRSGLQTFPSLNVLTSLVGEILLAGGRVLCGIVGVIPLRHG